eukprot:TRINITY_DN1868_c0_g1_i1.p1 TRINITY_DN1868_c0_g1~~TRINITY_DN1868_c0_g1_i1.p1  ORF type:complete len:422 (+),score=52.78 TRINITY_DN1868_c0_g1_i1:62-1327(+)
MEADSGVSKQLLQRASQLEREIHIATKEKRHSQVASLRTTLRSHYEQLILSHYNVAVKQDIELCLWQQCFYKAIQEYRERVRRAAQATAKNQTRSAKEEQQKLCRSFRGFLESSTEFYHQLVQKLQTYYDLDLGHLFSSDDPLVQQYTSCHRCFVILGDLARYHRDLINDPAQKNWAQAAVHYQKAIKLWPDNGHPHNQLAVLCAYKDDEFRTLYHYYRALMSKIPFNTARDNINALFEKNRSRFSGETKSSRKERMEPKKQKLMDFFMIFVRLHGILVSRTSLNIFCSLLQNASELFGKLFLEDIFSEIVLTQMMVVNILTLTYVFETDETTKTYAHAANSSEAKNLAVSLALAFFNNLLGLCAELDDTRLEYADSSYSFSILLHFSRVLSCSFFPKNHLYEISLFLFRFRFWLFFFLFF